MFLAALQYPRNQLLSLIPCLAIVVSLIIYLVILSLYTTVLFGHFVAGFLVVAVLGEFWESGFLCQTVLCVHRMYSTAPVTACMGAIFNT